MRIYSTRVRPRVQSYRRVPILFGYYYSPTCTRAGTYPLRRSIPISVHSLCIFCSRRKLHKPPLLVIGTRSIVQCSKDTIDLRGDLWRKRPRLLSLQILIVASCSIHWFPIAGRQPCRNALSEFFVRPFLFHPIKLVRSLHRVFCK